MRARHLPGMHPRPDYHTSLFTFEHPRPRTIGKENRIIKCLLTLRESLLRTNSQQLDWATLKRISNDSSMKVNVIDIGSLGRNLVQKQTVFKIGPRRAKCEIVPLTGNKLMGENPFHFIIHNNLSNQNNTMFVRLMLCDIRFHF
jgi:hypothetical protein